MQKNIIIKLWLLSCIAEIQLDMKKQDDDR